VCADYHLAISVSGNGNKLAGFLFGIVGADSNFNGPA